MWTRYHPFKGQSSQRDSVGVGKGSQALPTEASRKAPALSLNRRLLVQRPGGYGRKLGWEVGEMKTLPKGKRRRKTAFTDLFIS